MIYDKGKSVPVSVRFDSSDFDCKCNFPSCTTTNIEPRLVDALDDLFDIAGEFKINSGYRCKKHNRIVGGKDDSQHLIGKAVDIESLRSFSGPEMARFANEVEAFSKGGMGVAEHWIHIDVRLGRARWTYPTTH